LSHRWDYAIAWLLRNEQSMTVPGNHWGRYGINQQLFYTINDRWSLGLGVEWLKHYDNITPENYDVCSLRFEANWKPNAWFTLKPEIRYDKCDGIRPFNITKSGGTAPKDGQFLYGLSGVVAF